MPFQTCQYVPFFPHIVYHIASCRHILNSIHGYKANIKQGKDFMHYLMKSAHKVALKTIKCHGPNTDNQCSPAPLYNINQMLNNKPGLSQPHIAKATWITDCFSAVTQKENGDQRQQCCAESMERGLTDVDVIQPAHAVVVQTELLLSVLPCPLPQCPLSIGMTDSHECFLTPCPVCSTARWTWSTS